MQLIKPSVIEITQEPSVVGVINMIDYCAGICYGREFAHVGLDKQKTFVENLVKKNHMRPLEFGTIYLKIRGNAIQHIGLLKLPWCHVVKSIDKNEIVYYVTTNQRYLVEHSLQHLLTYWCEPTEHHVKRRTFKIRCSRAVADEYRTHISLSSLMQSTRYCKLDPLQVISPQWFDTAPTDVQKIYTDHLNNCEDTYRTLLRNNLTPQHARGVLPMDMATTLILCGTVGIDNWGWDRFIQMRVSKEAAPEASLLATQIKQKLYDSK